MIALNLKLNKDKKTFRYQGYDPTSTTVIHYCYKLENNQQYSSDQEIEL